MPLKMKVMGTTSSDRILTERQIYKIFQNIEEIKNTAKIMWKKLEDECKKWPDNSPLIGAVFLSLMSEIRTHYHVYVKGISKAFKNLSKLKKASLPFFTFVEDCDSSNPIMPLHLLLMLPIERIVTYEWNIKELYILTPADHVDFGYLSKAQKFLANINAELAQYRNEIMKIQKLYRVEANVKGSPASMLQFKGNIRELIREGPISMVVNERRSKRSYLYLFNDILVVAELNESNEEKVFEYLVALNGADVKELQGNSFSVLKENRRIVFEASTKAEKDSWIKDIVSLITRLTS